MTPEFVTVATTDEIPAGTGRCFEIGHFVVAVFNIDGKFSAINDLCPHMGASLSAGHLSTADATIACPWHGWRFNVVDGSWADNPRVKTDVFEIRVVDGQVQVRPEPVPAAAVQPRNSVASKRNMEASND